MRKPHVFISSRLTMGILRKDIRSILEKSGFTVEIYEADSTPSFEPATYLKDIEHADFVIFIFDETYGTPRPSTGKSGIHEEWDIVKTRKIPNHVYLKRKPKVGMKKEQKAFIQKELQENEISYFYWTSEAELRTQVRKSIVKMALDIAQSPDFRSNLTRISLAGEVAKRDHNTYYLWDRAIQLINRIEHDEGCSTNAWSIFLDIYEPFSIASLRPFVDPKMQEMFAKFLSEVGGFSTYESNHVLGYSAELGSIPFPRQLQMIQRLRVQKPVPSDYYDRIEAMKTSSLDLWKLIGTYITERYSRYADL